MMEGTSLRKLVLSIVIVMMMMVELTKAELHYVGGNKAGWTPNTNFSEWTSHEKFLVGDWLCMLSLSLNVFLYELFGWWESVRKKWISYFNRWFGLFIISSLFSFELIIPYFFFLPWWNPCSFDRRINISTNFDF